jgi:tetratricopeptide (TPR) repeat protein
VSVRILWKGLLGLTVLLALSLVAAGCGSDGDDGDSGDKKGSTASKESKDPKVRQVAESEDAFEKEPQDVNACKNLALSYVALASPTSSGKANEPVEPPKDREENMKKAADTYEQCRQLAPKDVDVKRSLASSYMSVGDYEKATPLLEEVAKQAKNQPNDYYAWGLAASNARDTKSTIEAWEAFLRFVPKGDPRIVQVRRSLVLLRQEQKGGAPKAATPPAAPAAAAKDADAGSTTKGGGDTTEATATTTADDEE